MRVKRTNEEWLRALRSSGPSQDEAIADLRDLLLRAALYFFGRNLGDFQGLGRGEVLQRAEDCAQQALMTVLEHLSDFRGDSRFTTWAYKFAINIAMTTSRQERWKAISLDDLVSTDGQLVSEKILKDEAAEAAPEQRSLRSEVRGVIRDVIENELTEKQQRVLTLMVFEEVPMDVVVRELGTNRNAVYKLLHDARRRLKGRLERHGFPVEEALALFGSPG